MRRILLLNILIVLIFAASPAKGQFIAEILSYKPAPGQHINTFAGSPEAAESIVGRANGLLSLGAFGGYVIFRFDNPVADNPDHPYGIDFTLFGNSIGTWSEPGIVSVMRDDNRNGLADDTWYELAGSEYSGDSTIHDYSVTYYNPGPDGARDVNWENNQGHFGAVSANTSHTQPYYPDPILFPGVDQVSYTLSGTRIYSTIDTSVSLTIFSNPLDYGYADNGFRGSGPVTFPDNPLTDEVEGAGGDPMDIGWAVDYNGNPTDLDTIHFVKVHTAVQAMAGGLGEISTELSGASIVDTSLIPVSSAPTRELILNPLVYPNPATLDLTIRGVPGSDYRILSISGQLMHEGRTGSETSVINVSSYPRGLYLLVIIMDGDTRTDKILLY